MLQRNISVHHSVSDNYRFSISGNDGDKVYVWARRLDITGASLSDLRAGADHRSSAKQNLFLRVHDGKRFIDRKQGDGGQATRKDLFYDTPHDVFPYAGAQNPYVLFGEVEGNTTYFGAAVYGARVGQDVYAYTFESSDARSLKKVTVPVKSPPPPPPVPAPPPSPPNPPSPFPPRSPPPETGPDVFRIMRGKQMRRVTGYA